MTTDAFPSPLRHFAAQLNELRSGDVLDMDQVGRLLVDLAADEEYLGPLSAEMPPEVPGGKWLIKPERGPAWCCSTGQRGLWPTPTPTSAGLGSLRSAEWRLISGGTQFAMRATGPNCALQMTAPCTAVTSRR